MRFINFAIVKFSLFLVLGILYAHFFPISFLFLIPLLIIFGIFFIFWLFARQQLIQQVFLGITAYVCFFCIGVFCYQINMPNFNIEHYSHNVNDDSPQIIQLKISQSLKPDKFNFKYFANINAVNGKPATGKILVNIKKDSLSKSFLPDDILLVYAPISKIHQPLNPHQFDYSNYIKLQGAYGQIRISENEILKAKTGRSTIFGIAQNIRANIVQKLKQTKLKTDERAIVQAFVLGEKNDIDKNLYSDYANAGAAHILAVSGLHVGILYIILSFFLQPLNRMKHGIVVQVIFVIVLLWCFAFLSGLSPSVTRAVTMFSFITSAKLLHRKTNTLNTLFLSLLVLLIIKPLWLFQVGFQLSYLAVFFIVWLYPIFNKVTYSKYWVVRKISAIVSVTLCAQLGVLPLTLYYFHQFPGLFIITNIVVLPLISGLMLGGILIVLLTVLNCLPDWLSEIYNSMIETLNTFIHWVATQEEFLFKDINFSILKIIVTYVTIISCGLFLRSLLTANEKVNYQKLRLSLFSISIFIVAFIYDEFRTSPNHLIIFHKSGKTLIGHKGEKEFTLFKNDSTVYFIDTYPIKSYKTAINITSYTEKKLPTIFRYNQKNILIIDNLGLYPKRRNIHTVILSKNPKTNLSRLIDSLQPKQIIADGSNYRTYINRWKKTCEFKKLPFTYTGEQGAFLIE